MRPPCAGDILLIIRIYIDLLVCMCICASIYRDGSCMCILKKHHLCLSFCGHYHQGHELSSLLLLLTQLVFACIQVEHVCGLPQLKNTRSVLNTNKHVRACDIMWL